MAKTAFLFPGQGAQTVGMGKELYAELPAAKALFDRAGDRQSRAGKPREQPLVEAQARHPAAQTLRHGVERTQTQDGIEFFAVEVGERFVDEVSKQQFG